MFPRVVTRLAELEMEHGAPLGTLGFVKQFESSLGRRTVALAAIARHAGADDIFPGSFATTITRDDVIEIEVLAVELVATILAGVVITLEDVVTGKFYFLLRHAIKEKKKNDLGHANLEGHGADDIGAFITSRKTEPLIEGHGLECTATGLNDLCMALVEQHEGTFDTTNIDGLPETIQHEDVVAEDRFHVIP